MEEKQLEKNKSSNSNISANDETKIDLIDLLRKIIHIRKALYKAAGIGLILSVIITFSIPKQYTVKVTLSPEVGNSKGNNGLAGLAASFLGSEVSTGNGSDALNVSLSDNIISSTPFLLELLKIKVSTTNKDTNISLENYLTNYSSPWWNYVINIPGIIVREIKLCFHNKKNNQDDRRQKQGAIEISKEENRKLRILQENITTSIDKQTAITTISVTLQDPEVTAIVADSVIQKLQEYIINYRTSKAKEDCIYLEKMFKERQTEYYAAQKKYADYVDANDNLILQSVRTEEERLQNDMNLAYQVYSQVSNQLQVARAKVQEEKPVFAVVEPAVIPLQPSGTNIMVFAFIFIFLAMISTICWQLTGKRIWNKLKNEVQNKE